MGSGLHGSARTTPRVRAELQAAQAPSRAIARAYGVNPKTVLKWRNRDTTADAAMGPKPRSTTLTEAEEDQAAKPIDAPQGHRRVPASHPAATR